MFGGMWRDTKDTLDILQLTKVHHVRLLDCTCVVDGANVGKLDHVFSFKLPDWSIFATAVQ